MLVHADIFPPKRSCITIARSLTRWRCWDVKVLASNSFIRLLCRAKCLFTIDNSYWYQNRFGTRQTKGTGLQSEIGRTNAGCYAGRSCRASHTRFGIRVLRTDFDGWKAECGVELHAIF